MTPAQREVAFPGRTRSNLLGDLVPGAEQESKGYEADLIFQPTRNWQLLFSYAHNDQKVVSAANASTIGQSNTGSIKNQFSVLTKFSFDQGPLKNTYVGVGFQVAGRALQGYVSTFNASNQAILLPRYNPSTFYAEVFGGYRFKIHGYNTSLQLNVKNLTQQDEFVGWRATGTRNLVATRRYEVPTQAQYSLTLGLDF